MPSDKFITVKSGPGLELNPVLNILNSMIVLCHRGQCTSEKQGRDSQLIFNGLYHAIIPQKQFADFPSYLDYMASCDPLELKENVLNFYKDKHDWKTGTYKSLSSVQVGEKVLSSTDQFLNFLFEAFDPANIDKPIEKQAFKYLNDPPAMQMIIHLFLQDLWETRFRQRWDESKDDLIDFISKTDLSYLRNLSQIQAVSHMTGLEIREENLAFALQKDYRLQFIPNKDVGEIYSKMLSRNNFYIFFNPDNFEKRRLYSQLNNIEELARKLGAVGDPNRLKIIKYISGHGEACSQDILKDTGFSQSAVSRHLKMLSDSGILIERRQVSAKFYRLNGEYLHNILHSFTDFLEI